MWNAVVKANWKRAKNTASACANKPSSIIDLLTDKVTLSFGLWGYRPIRFLQLRMDGIAIEPTPRYHNPCVVAHCFSVIQGNGIQYNKIHTSSRVNCAKFLMITEILACTRFNQTLMALYYAYLVRFVGTRCNSVVCRMNYRANRIRSRQPSKMD